MGTGARLGARQLAQEVGSRFGSDSGWDGDKAEGGLKKSGRDLPGGWAGRPTVLCLLPHRSGHPYGMGWGWLCP